MTSYITRERFTTPTLVSPTITGTVSGSATYVTITATSPTITGPTISGTVAGGATYTAPRFTGVAGVNGTTSANSFRVGADQASPISWYWRAANTSALLNAASTNNTLSIMSDDNGTNARRLDAFAAATHAGIFSNWTSGAIPFRFGAGTANQWEVSTAGHLTAFTDNTFDIGQSGANRPRDAYLAGRLTSVTATLSGALTYGGVTLSAAVTGTGAMVLANAPTFTGTALGPGTLSNLVMRSPNVHRVRHLHAAREHGLLPHHVLGRRRRWGRSGTGRWWLRLRSRRRRCGLRVAHGIEQGDHWRVANRDHWCGRRGGDGRQQCGRSWR